MILLCLLTDFYYNMYNFFFLFPMKPRDVILKVGGILVGHFLFSALCLISNNYWRSFNKHVRSHQVVQNVTLSCAYETKILHANEEKLYVVILGEWSTWRTNSLLWNWREIPTWFNNLFVIINNSTCFGHLGTQYG